jgi:hypothetical protein
MDVANASLGTRLVATETATQTFFKVAFKVGRAVYGTKIGHSRTRRCIRVKVDGQQEPRTMHVDFWRVDE